MNYMSFSQTILFSIAIALLIPLRLVKARQEETISKTDLTNFKDSFVEIIFDLKNSKPDVIFQLPGFLEQHEKAKTRLEMNLGPKAIKRLNKIWKQYRDNTKKYYSRFGGVISPSSANWPKKFVEEIEDMLNKINHITTHSTRRHKAWRW